MSFEKMISYFEQGALRPKEYEAYYETKSRLDALGISLPPKARVLEMQAPFAKMAIDVLTEVLIPTEYVVAEDGHDDDIDLLSKTWQKNNLDSQFNLGASEALASGSVYWIVAPPDETHEFATVRAVDNRHARVRVDYKGDVVEGIAVYRLPDGAKGATYYTTEGVSFYALSGSTWYDTGQGRVDTWGPSIVPMFNKARLKDRYGRSDLAELRTVIDAASRTLTNVQVFQEVSAMPLRVLSGDGAAEALAQYPDVMSAYMGKMLAAPDGTSISQVSGGNLDPFLNTYKTYALQISAMTGIPPSMMGVAADNNPTSADALRVAKDRLISRAENKQRQFSDAMEQVARLVIAMNGRPTDGLETLELMWRDAASPSRSAMMATALQAQSQGVISDSTARTFLGLSPELLKKEDDKSDDVARMSGMTMARTSRPSLDVQDPTAARQVQAETNPTSATVSKDES